MKKILIIVAIFVFALLFKTIPVSANSICDETCQRILNGENSHSLGYTNVIKSLVIYFDGDLQNALNIAGLSSNTLVSNANANSLYDVPLNGTVLGLYVCQSDFQYCSAGQILGYTHVEHKWFRYICTPGGECKKELFSEDK